MIYLFCKASRTILVSYSHWMNAYWTALCSEIKRPEGEYNSLLAFRPEVTNEWSYTTIPLISLWCANRQVLLCLFLKILVSLTFFPRLNICNDLTEYLLQALTSTNICRPGSARLFPNFQPEQKLKGPQIDTIVDSRWEMTTELTTSFTSICEVHTNATVLWEPS
jgi:hypothetical protein